MTIRTSVMAGAILAMGLATPLAAPVVAQDMSKVEIKVHDVRDGIYMLEGQGGNIGISTGDDGVLMIDDQFAPLTDKIKAAIETVSDKPVTFLVNTHWHGDHTGGNEKWGDMGAIIVAQDNVYQSLSHPAKNPLSGADMPAAPEGAWPVVTFPQEMTFHWNGQTVDVHHIPNAHTNGDVFLHFEEANVIHGGDVANMGSYPIIDRFAGGTFMGYVSGQEQILAAMDDDTILIPGHGPISSKQDLQDCHDMLVTIVQRVQGAKAEHLPLETIQAMGLTKEYDERWGQGFVTAAQTIENIYNELP